MQDILMMNMYFVREILMPREEISVDIPKEWNENMRHGRCWCGKPKAEFTKGQKFYCSKAHGDEYARRIKYWSVFKDEVLEEKGKKCIVCNRTKEIFEKQQKALQKSILIEQAKEHPDALHEARSEMLKELQEKLEKIWQDDYVMDEMTWQMRQKHRISTVREVHDREWFGLEVDHIKAVALGGEMWDKDNLQVLCSKCHKIKTREDMRKIKYYKKAQGLEKVDATISR